MCRTECFRDGDVADDRDQRHHQDAGLQVLGHVDEALSLIADRPPKRGRLDAREAGVDVTREDERHVAVRLEDVGRDRAEDDHERVPGRADRPEEPPQLDAGDSLVLEVLGNARGDVKRAVCDGVSLRPARDKNEKMKWRQNGRMYLEEQQNRNTTAGQDQVRRPGVGDVVGQLAPYVDEALAVDVEAQQALNLAAGDDEARGRREAGHHRYRHELHQEAQAQDTEQNRHASR